MKIETLAIGDEILTGKISDTNSTFIARSCFELGLTVAQQTVIPDQLDTIKHTVKEISERADICVSFGGLGPTSDDLTVDAVCEMMGATPVVLEESEKKLRDRYAQQKKVVTSTSLRQVRYPDQATPFFNQVGLAPGFSVRLNRCDFLFLPGVPAEMKSLWTNAVLPYLKDTRLKQPLRKSKIFKCMGIWESELQDLLSPVEKSLPDFLRVGYRTTFPENHILLYYDPTFAGRDSLEVFENSAATIQQVLKPFCFTENDESLEETLVHLLRSKNFTIAFAESATAGLATHRLSRVPGVTDQLWGGVATYQKNSKQALLGVVRPNEESCISEETSREMAKSLMSISQCQVVAAVTGLAGANETPTKSAYFYFCIQVRGKDGIQSQSSKIEFRSRSRYEDQWGASSYLLWNLIKILRS